MPTLPVVVVVENQSELGAVIQDVLEDEGYDVVAVRDQFGAIGVLRQQSVDMLIVDLPRPGPGEADPLTELTTEFPDLPLVVLHDEDEEELPFFGPWRREGSRVTMRRPFRLDDLVSATRDLVG